MEIRFYKVKDAYGAFSNFAPFPVSIMGIEWKTSEHYFQARKFLDVKLFQAILDADTPMMACEIGRNPKNKPREDWDEIKYSVMKEAVEAKFTQYYELMELLKSTKNHTIIEASPYDYYWGEGKDRSGHNKLGKILMEIREEQSQFLPPLPPWEFNAALHPNEFGWSQGMNEQVLVEWQIYIRNLPKQYRAEYFDRLHIPEEWKPVVLLLIDA